jgi:hypothetical protein
LFFFSSNFQSQHPAQPGGDAKALPWQMRWSGFQTVGYEFLLPSQRPDGTRASPLALMVSGLRWNAKSTLNRPVHTFMYCGPRRRKRSCAAIRSMTLRGQETVGIEMPDADIT